MDPLPVFKGLFGPLVIRAPGEQAPEAEFFLGFHTWEPPITGLKENYSCINGRAYAGNTPDLHAKVGQRVGFHVYGLDNFFHTFHLHGHRWTEPDGRSSTPKRSARRTRSGSNSSRTTRAAGSTTATSSTISTWG